MFEDHYLRKMLTPRSFLALPLLLIPSAVYLWHFSDIPQFGALHDDGLYYVAAKSLADGGGYRIESLPGEPGANQISAVVPTAPFGCLAHRSSVSA